MFEIVLFCFKIPQFVRGDQKCQAGPDLNAICQSDVNYIERLHKYHKEMCVNSKVSGLLLISPEGLGSACSFRRLLRSEGSQKQRLLFTSWIPFRHVTTLPLYINSAAVLCAWTSWIRCLASRPAGVWSPDTNQPRNVPIPVRSHSAEKQQVPQDLAPQVSVALPHPTLRSNSLCVVTQHHRAPVQRIVPIKYAGLNYSSLVSLNTTKSCSPYFGGGYVPLHACI